MPGSRSPRLLFVSVLLLQAAVARGAEDRETRGDFARRYREQIRPIVMRHCAGCHSGTDAEAGVVLDDFPSDEELLRPQLWGKVLKNIRAGIMPPAPAARLTPGELAVVEAWIKRGAFGIDQAAVDPGHATVRRLNRTEYRFVIQDLLGHTYDTTENFPPDDTGHGFDNIGSLLQMSPLLVEKYLRAANEIVQAAVPATHRAVASRSIAPALFFGKGAGNDRISCQTPGRYTATAAIQMPGTYAIRAKFQVFGNVFPTAEKTIVRVHWAGEPIHSETYAWQPEHDGPTELVEGRRELAAGETELAFEIDPLVGDGPKPRNVPLTFRLVSVELDGPLEEAHWVAPVNYSRFFHRPEPPDDPAARRDYAREILRTFVGRAYRRPADEPTLDGLVALAEEGTSVPGATFEHGIQQAMTAVLASRRFLFRIEPPPPAAADEPYPLIDEYSLASRLSFLLWSSIPDDELLDLAERRILRANLDSQVTRMLRDPRSGRFIESFVGQWLRTREVNSVEIDPRLVLARDGNVEQQELAFREEMNRLFLERREEEERRFLRGEKEDDKPQRSIFALMKTKAPALPTVNLDDGLRSAMRRETEACFSHVLYENRSLLELIDSDHTFLNERLASHYGIEGVKGPEFRKVTLPPESMRGGLLTHAGLLMITSQPTRTSAVKRGVFVLENLLGTPPPPPPPEIPALDDAPPAEGAAPATLRERLELHRRQAVCASCHRRMDPIGFALENFNALGLWRTEEAGAPLQIDGELVSGEPLRSVDDLRQALVGPRRADFYRCLIEKLLIYSLGRGLETTDIVFVDSILEQLEASGGRSMTLLMGVINSDAFQRCRGATGQDPPPAPRKQ